MVVNRLLDTSLHHRLELQAEYILDSGRPLTTALEDCPQRFVLTVANHSASTRDKGHRLAAQVR